MQERDYSQLTPEELQAEFDGILDQMPVSIFEYDNRMGILPGQNPSDDARYKALARRQQSEHLGKLMEKAGKLLAFCPGTESFKEDVLASLEVSYSYGRIIEPEAEKVQWNGIFLSSDIKRIERRKYGIAEVVWHELDKTFGEMIEGQDGKPSGRIRKSSARLEKWRGEFIELYGEEP